ncbi:hypothetical protein [Helicobacter cetorum]|uniref:Uncharacterized protein n=1 Tax=Helicobacter cetorum (strain ATCC BAA-429 / MIT 00-7128) TaxID=182217 RepID=I0ELL7_HELC0|nr:hypothetical protein [Helicobacter cetorum]AFI03836.1 hypothetical protein HCW_02775 [Helicobacter cetorum MIT 00-7128]
MRNVVENLEVNLNKDTKVDIKIDNKEMLEEYLKSRLKQSELKYKKITFSICFIVVCICLTCAYIFKGF